MGNSVEVNFQKNPNQNPSHSHIKSRTKVLIKRGNNSSFVSPFIRQSTQPIRLSNLRGCLSASECFYTLSTLIQQYYSLFKMYRKVVVSDHLCLVNQFGQIKVDFCIDGPDTPLLDYDQVTHCFLTAISQIVTLVERLAGRDELQNSRESLRFRRQLIDRVQGCHTNEEEIYHSAMQLLTSFLQGNDIRCNLIEAFLRYWSQAKSQGRCFLPPQQQTPFLANSRINHPIKHSLSTNNLNHDYYEMSQRPKRNQDTITRESHLEQRTHIHKPSSKYRHKMVKTQGENYYIAMGKRNEDYGQPSSFFAEETSHTRFEKNAFNRISHQYTLNILTTQVRPTGKLTKNSQNNKSSVSLKSNGEASNQIRRETSLNDITQYKMIEHSSVSVAGKSYAKSMLEQLARSVSIRDEPNSRDHIN